METGMFTPALTPCGTEPISLQVVYILLCILISTSKVQLAAVPAVLNVIAGSDSQRLQAELFCWCSSARQPMHNTESMEHD